MTTSIEDAVQVSDSTVYSDFAPNTWLRDACIDALGMIWKKSPESANNAVPMLMKLSKYASSQYTRKKALRALDAIANC
jgi:hypothetical protein